MNIEFLYPIPDSYWTELLPVFMKNNGFTPITSEMLAMNKEETSHYSEYCAAIVVRNQDEDIIATVPYSWFPEDKPYTLPFSILSGVPSFAKNCTPEQIEHIVKSVGLPVDWFASGSTKLKQKFPNGMLDYVFELPDSFEDYISSLDKKNRTECRKFMKRPITFKEITAACFRKTGSAKQWATSFMRQLKNVGGATSYVRVLQLFDKGVLEKYDILAVYENDSLIGYNLALLENGTYCDCFFLAYDLEKYESAGYYFSVIFKLIERLIKNRCAEKYSAGVGCDFKKKFVPSSASLGENTAYYIGLCNYHDSTPDMYTPEFLSKGRVTQGYSPHSFIATHEGLTACFSLYGHKIVHYNGSESCKGVVYDFIRAIYGNIL